MESEDRSLREDEVGLAIREGLRRVGAAQVSLSWQDVEQSARSCLRRRQRGLAGAALGVVVVVAVGVSLLIVRDPGEDREIATDQNPRVTGVAPPIGGSNPALSSVLALPSCDGEGDLAEWSRAAVAPYPEVAVGEPAPSALRDMTADVPVLADPPGATCTAALRLGDARAWEARNAAGEVVARAVSVPWVNNSVPGRMLESKRASYYHQEWLASGQNFSGFIQGRDLEALVRVSEPSRLVIGEFPSVDAKDHADGVDLLARLYAEPLASMPEGMAQYMPTQVPVGFGLCSFEDGTPPSFLLYCDSSGRTVRISSSWSEKLKPLPDSTPIAVGSFQGVTGLTSEGRRRIDLDLGTNLGTAYLTASPDLALDDLLATLESIPFLDPRLGQYRVGTGDAREYVTEDRLRELVENSGGTSVSVAPSVGEPPGVFVADFTGPLGESASAIFRAVPDGEDSQVPPGDRIVEIGEIDVSVVVKTHPYRAPGGELAQQRIQQVYGTCNRVFINVMMRPVAADQAIDFTRGIVAELGC